MSDVTILSPQLAAAVAIAVATGREILPLLLTLSESGRLPGSPVGDFLRDEPLSSVAPEDAWPKKEEDRLNRAVKAEELLAERRSLEAGSLARPWLLLLPLSDT